MGLTSTPPRIPVIHIGMPKTATKTLQWRLFIGHSEIYFLGRFDGPGPKYQKYRKKYDYCRDVLVQSLMNEIAYGRVGNPNYEKCKKILAKILATASENNLLPVWSWESYTTDCLQNNKVRAHNLKMVFGKAKIIINIRNPIGLIESAYFQQLKKHNAGSIRNFRFLPYYQTINNWLRDNYDGQILNHLQYAETIQAYIEEFGKENVHVFLFEDLIDNQRNYFIRLCDAMGINSEEGIMLCSEKVENARWTTNQTSELIKITQSIKKSLSFSLSGRKKRRLLLNLNEHGRPINPGKKAHANISPEWQEKIFNQTRQGHLWLQENYKLPLDKYGYLGNKGKT